MRRRRCDPGKEPSEFLGWVRRELERWLSSGEEPPPEVRLLRSYDSRRRGFRSHTQAFVVVNGMLTTLWAVLGVTVGVWFPWFLFPLMGWGIGYSLHALGHRSWLADHREELTVARERLGLLPGPSSTPSSRWDLLEQRCQGAVEATLEVLDKDEEVLAPEPLKERLEEGLTQMKALLDGARRIDTALNSILPGGVEAMRRDIDDLEAEHARTWDERSRGVLEQKRGLLLTRRAQVEQLLADQERAADSAEGFVLAAENVRLDVLRLSSGSVEVGALEASVQTLHDEVDILRRVQRDLQ